VDESVDESVDGSRPSMVERVGGQPWFDDLVDRFYARVDTDPILRPLYPDDLVEPKRHLAGFLAQYWGGPPRYSEERGHPRLRQRHLPFSIGRRERDAWFAAMDAAVREGDLPADDEAEMLAYFDQTATFLINESEDGALRLGMRPR
jgi:hemoglobin